MLRTVRGIDAILLLSSSGLYQEGQHPKAYHKIKDSKAGEQGSREIENQGLKIECAKQHTSQFPPGTGTPSLGDYISIYGHGRREQCHLHKFRRQLPKISKEEQEEEEEFYRENRDAPPAMWSVGGWVLKKDAPEPARKKRKLSKEKASREPVVFAQELVDPGLPSTQIMTG